MKLKRNQVAIVLMAFLLMACKEDPVKTAAKTFKDVAQTLGVLQASVIEANGKGLISDNDTRSILQTSIRINEAGLRGTALLRTVHGNLEKSEQEQVVAVLDSVLRELITLNGSLTIQDQKTLNGVRQSITLIEATVNSTKLLVAASGGNQ